MTSEKEKGTIFRKDAKVPIRTLVVVLGGLFLLVEAVGLFIWIILGASRVAVNDGFVDFWGAVGIISLPAIAAAVVAVAILVRGNFIEY